MSEKKKMICGNKGIKHLWWIVVLISCVGCQRGVVGTRPAAILPMSESETWREYKNELFAVDYPAAWEVAHQGWQFVFAEADGTVEVVIVAGDLTDLGFSAEFAAEDIMAVVLEELAAEEMVFQPTAVSVSPYRESAQMEAHSNNGSEVVQTVLVIVHEGKAAIIKGVNEVEQQSLIEQMLRSFRFLVDDAL